MDISAFGIGTVAAITALCYLVGLIVKATPFSNNKFIPIACGVSGLFLGIAGYIFGMPEFPAQDYITAAAVGCVSGLAATGIDQIAKQLKTNT